MHITLLTDYPSFSSLVRISLCPKFVFYRASFCMQLERVLAATGGTSLDEQRGSEADETDIPTSAVLLIISTDATLR